MFCINNNRLHGLYLDCGTYYTRTNIGYENT